MTKKTKADEDMEFTMDIYYCKLAAVKEHLVPFFTPKLHDDAPDVDKAQAFRQGRKETQAAILRFCKAEHLQDEAALDAGLQSGFIKLSDMTDFFQSETDTPQQATVTADSVLTANQSDPRLCSMILAMEIHNILGGNLQTLETYGASKLWKMVWSNITGERAPRLTPQLLPGLFALEYDTFERWFKYHKAEFYDMVRQLDFR